jgi:alpha-tubulin suppressor-like RCC1 family protein
MRARGKSPAWCAPRGFRGLARLLAVLLVAGAVAATAPPASAAPIPGNRTFAWGANVTGQLGDGTDVDRPLPVPTLLPPGTTVTALAGGTGFSLALDSAGQVWSWGANDQGQLGIEVTGAPVFTPQQVHLPVGTTISAISTNASASFALALTSDGRVFAWGNNVSGQTGTGTTGAPRPTPVQAVVPAPVRAIGTGGDHGMAVDDTGQVWTWGNDVLGQLGNGTTGGVFPLPAVVTALAGTGITEVAGGANFSLALTSAGGVRAWGANGEGELGIGTFGGIYNTPQTTIGLTAPVTRIAAGAFHSLAITTAGNALAWGYNADGELGDNSTTDRSTPVAVLVPPGTTVTAISGGAFHSLALTSAHRVLAWGDNSSGELGNGSSGFGEFSAVPLFSQLPGGVSIGGIAAGAFDSFAFTRTTTTLAASSTSPPAGTPVTLTATVDCGQTAPTGQVQFFEGVTVVGTGTLSGTPGTTSITLPSPALGPHTFTAVYDGNGDGSCPTSESNPVTVTVMPASSTTSLAATPPNPAFGQPVTLTATVFCALGPTGQVRFLEGSTLLGTANLTGTGPTRTASLTLPGLAPGPHTFTAQYPGDTNCAASTGSTPVVPVSCARTISTTITGNVLVTTPTCVTATGRIIGSVVISGAGSLAMQGGQILGTLAANGGTGLLLCGSSVSGSLSVTGTTGVIVIGDAGDDGTPACSGNTISGSVTISGTTGFLEVGGNRIAGSVTLIGNTTTILVPPENAPATELEANDIVGSLVCSGNTPPPVNDGLPNRVHGARAGQCAGL